MAADVDLNRNIVEFRGFSLYSKFLPLPHLNRNIVEFRVLIIAKRHHVICHLNRNIVEFREQTVVFYSDSAF